MTKTNQKHKQEKINKQESGDKNHGRIISILKELLKAICAKTDFDII